MSYLLYRTDDEDSPSIALGEFADFDAALAARDDDVISQLATQPAPAREISHLIVGPGLDGTSTAHPCTTFAGVDFAHPAPADELADLRAWLHRIHGV